MAKHPDCHNWELIWDDGVGQRCCVCLICGEEQVFHYDYEPRVRKGDICVIRKYSIAVQVLDFYTPPDTDAPTAFVRFLEDFDWKPEKSYKIGDEGLWFVDELVTVRQLCEEYSDFMTFTASVMNLAPKDEPVNKSVVWRFWNLGRQARLYLVKWKVSQQLD